MKKILNVLVVFLLFISALPFGQVYAEEHDADNTQENTNIEESIIDDSSQEDGTDRAVQSITILDFNTRRTYAQRAKEKVKPSDGFISMTYEEKGEVFTTTDYSVFENFDEQRYWTFNLNPSCTECFEGQYQVNGDIIGYSTVFIIPDDAVVTLDVKPINILTTGVLNPADGFNKLTVDDKVFDNYDDFIASGGEIETDVPAPLESGLIVPNNRYELKYIYGDTVETVNVNVERDLSTVYDNVSIELKDVTVYSNEDFAVDYHSFFVKATFVKDGYSEDIYDADEFLARGGIHHNRVGPSIPDGFITEWYFKIDNAKNKPEEKALFTYLFGTKYSIIDTKDLDLLTSSSFSEEDGFVNMEINMNGVVSNHDFQSFSDLGGTIESTVPNPLVPGTYTITYNFENEKAISTVKVTKQEVVTKDVYLDISESYDKKDSFESLIITSPETVETVHNYEKFVDLGGTSKTTVPTPLVVGEFETEFILNGVSTKSKVEVTEEEPATKVEIETKDLDKLTTDTISAKDGFVNMKVTTNGVEENYNYSQFQTLGGTTKNLVPNPLEAGIFTITYEFGGVTNSSTVRITDRKINTKIVTIFEAQSYDVEDSFVNLVITDPNLVETTLNFEQYTDLGGKASTSAKPPLFPGEFVTTFTLGDLVETVDVYVNENEIEYTLEAEDLDLFTTDTFDQKDGFKELTITTNGNAVIHNFNKFEQEGGTVTSTVPTPLEAGTYTVTYELGGETAVSTVKITDRTINVKDVTVYESNSYKYNDGFISLVITNPNNTVQTLDYAAFINEGGKVTSNVPQILVPGNYYATYTLGDTSETSNVLVESDVVTIKVETKDLDLLTTDTVEEGDGFVNLEVTKNGVVSNYNYEKFKQMGGVTTSTTPNPLEAGTYQIVYRYDTTSSESIVKVTDRKLNVKDVTVFESGSYEVEDSYVGLVVTDPNGVEKTLNYTEFKALGGSATTTVTDPLSKGNYKTTFKLGAITEVSNVTVNEDVITYELEAKDLNLLTSDTFNQRDGFVNYKVTTNGVAVDYDFDEFDARDGSVTSTVPTPLEAGTYSITYELNGASAESIVKITDRKLTVKDVTVFESGSYEVEDSYVGLVVTDPNGVEKTLDYTEFKALGGSATSTVPDPLSKGNYETTFTLGALTKTSHVTVNEDVSKYEIEAKDLNLLTSDTFNQKDGFVNLKVTTNGVAVDYDFAEFEQKGGSVTSTVPTPLEAGTFSVEYELNGATAKSIVKITERKLNVKDVNLFEGENYDIEDSYVGLDVTDPNGVKTTLTFDEFLALGGSSTSDVVTPAIEGVYETTFTIGDLTAVSNVTVVKNTVSVIIETNDLDLLASETFDSSNGFANMRIITNGNVENHDYESFLILGGTSISRVPDPLEAGTYTVTYEYGGETGISTVKITERTIKVKDVSIHENETYSEKDSFVGLDVINPDGTETTYTYDQFIGLGGTVSTTVPSDLVAGEYETMFTLDGVSKTSKVSVEALERIVEIFTKPVISEKGKYHVSQGFDKLVITENGISTTYDFDAFIQMGGTVSVSQHARMRANSLDSLEVGVYDVVYAFENVEGISRTEIINPKDPETEKPEVKPEEPENPEGPKEPENPKEETHETLPSAGMSSNNTIYIIGGLLVLVGGVLIILKKRNK